MVIPALGARSRSASATGETRRSGPYPTASAAGMRCALSTLIACLATAPASGGSGRSYRSVSLTSARGRSVPITTTLLAGWNPSSTGTTASTAVGELIRIRRSVIVRASGATPAARPLPDPALAADPRGVESRCVEPRCVDPRGVDLRRGDPPDADPRDVVPRDVAPRGADGLRRDPGFLAGGFLTGGGAGGVLVVAVFA